MINKYSETIGDGELNQFKVLHNLGTHDVIVEVYDYALGCSVITDVTRYDDNTVIIDFAHAPKLDAYRVVIIG